MLCYKTLGTDTEVKQKVKPIIYTDFWDYLEVNVSDLTLALEKQNVQLCLIYVIVHN